MYIIVGKYSFLAGIKIIIAGKEYFYIKLDKEQVKELLYNTEAQIFLL
ncbi:hypothetical protein LY28_01622 [Ruminiclostridium sufflavum DSM 19573]|uniref:Uncharacterized protein n=1 Tax=Ruminiclostridium sufflavum DSM 19573 TaxID=1121337 RepID=A0A318XZD8_9FIRM|nr:hypothetical protein [Ruminiclostridium sufflavum]PYG88280.1 hypothetical protein LY28_01622 [Ruminiclostridium sufflavum DSM 19573]